MRAAAWVEIRWYSDTNMNFRIVRHISRHFHTPQLLDWTSVPFLRRIAPRQLLNNQMIWPCFSSAQDVDEDGHSPSFPHLQGLELKAGLLCMTWSTPARKQDVPQQNDFEVFEMVILPRLPPNRCGWVVVIFRFNLFRAWPENPGPSLGEERKPVRNGRLERDPSVFVAFHSSQFLPTSKRMPRWENKQSKHSPHQKHYCKHPWKCLPSSIVHVVICSLYIRRTQLTLCFAGISDLGDWRFDLQKKGVILVKGCSL